MICIKAIGRLRCNRAISQTQLPARAEGPRPLEYQVSAEAAFYTAAVQLCDHDKPTRPVLPGAMQSLRNHYLFAGLDEVQFDALLGRTQICDLSVGEALFRQGDVATAFFVVTGGAMALYRVSSEGHEKIMRLIQPGQSFAESVMFMATPRYPVHARASQASRVVAIDTAAYLEVMQTSFATCLSVFARMTERIQAHWDEIEALALQNSRYRIVHYLLGLAPQSGRGAATITLPARKVQIAAQLAVTPETLSRVLGALHHDGLIGMHGYCVDIPDIRALRRELG